MARRHFRSPHPVFPILPPPRVRRFLSRHQVLLLIFTGMVILSGVLGGASLLILRSSAASPAVLPSAPASWQSGSGNSGTAFSQSLSYDPASNLTSLSTTQAAVPGQSNSGGSETQVFCYDEQNRLTWAGNTGTPTCSGTGTPSVSGNLGAYGTSYVYIHLGQLWQAPLNGGSTQQQYLYCSASQSHQLTGLYALGATCSNKTGQVYATSYDAWGNVTSRTSSGTTATLTYDLLDHLIKWYVSSTNQEQYVYDANGERVLRRSTNSSGTTMTVYAFGLEEHTYTGSGTLLSSTYYYSLAGKLIGALDANGTTFYLTDALGSLLASFSNTANSATLKSNQLYGPYGNARYTVGTLNTAKGFTGQYNLAFRAQKHERASSPMKKPAHVDALPVRLFDQDWSACSSCWAVYCRWRPMSSPCTTMRSAAARQSWNICSKRWRLTPCQSFSSWPT